MGAVVVRILIGAGSALVATWVALAVAVLVLRPPGESARQLLGFAPRVLRLLAALYRDGELPRGARWRVRIALLYDVQPFNLIPDFIPVVGFVDNVIVTLWALRSVIRLAGGDMVRRHWPGTASELDLLYRLGRLGTPPAP